MKKNIYKRTLCLIISAVVFLSLSPVSFAEDTARIDAVEAYVRAVLKNARFIERSAFPQLFVDGFNIDTLKPVEWKWGNKTYYPANFFNQQDFMRTLVALSELTGNEEYKEIAKTQMKLWLENFTDSNGLVYAGAHTFIDVKTGEVVTTGDHEMKDNTPFYELMYEVDPEATIKYMEAFWNAHILDWSNLSMNRHGAYDKEMGDLWDSEYTDTSINFNNGEAAAFQSTGNDLIAFAFFISEKTGDKRAEEWALRLLQKYIEVADDDTGLSGAQYGEMDGGDRAQLQFGEEFGELAKEYNFVNRYKIEITAGYAPLVLLPYYESLSDEEKTEKKYILDYVVKSIEGVAKHAYDAETNTLKTPMWSDGTSLQGYVLRRNGYYGNEGSKLATSEKLSGPILSAAIYAHKLSGSETIWEFARTLAKWGGLGDIGTAPGENVALIMDTDTLSNVGVLLSLYRQTGHEDYLKLAEHIGDNILTDAPRKGDLFLRSASTLNQKIDNGNPMTLLSIEAAKQGKTGVMPGGSTSSGIDMYYDGLGRVVENTVIYHKTRVNATSVSLDKDAVSITLLNNVSFTDISGHSGEKYIKQIAALGAVAECENAAFAPDDNITRGEFIEYCARLCGLSDIETAIAAGLIDENFESNASLYPDTDITVEEAASVIARALTYKNPKNDYSACGALSQFKDSADISDWAHDYCDIAANYYIFHERGDEYFSPKSTLTRAEAAEALKKMSDFCEVDAKTLKSSVEPMDAQWRNVFYTSSNPDIVEVDENGRLFPIKPGNAVITATCGGVSDNCNVRVVSYEDWMLKSIEINGEKIEDFSALNRQYTFELPISTTQLPTINATPYSDKDVTIIMPKIIPGVAKIYVEDEDEIAYMVSLLPDKRNYVVNESFDGFPIGMTPHSIVSDKVTWHLHSSGWTNGAAPSEIVEHPIVAQNYGRAVSVPYKGYQMQFSGRFFDNPYTTGSSGDADSVIVVEYDLMTTAAFNGLSVMLGDHTANGNTWAIVQNYTDDTIKLHNNSTVGTYAPNEVHRIKMVINKKTLKSDVYLNGEMVLSAQAPKTLTPQIDYFMINATKDLDVSATVYVDNVKIYELPIITDIKYNFYDADANAITRIGEELTVSFNSELGTDYDDGEELQLLCAIYTPEGTLKRVELHDAQIGSTSSGQLSTSVSVDDMDVGDYLCVYAWTKELCPIIVQKLIYKC